MIAACDACLRRAQLVAHLSPRIAGLLDRPGNRTRALLALPDEELVAAASGPEGRTPPADLDAGAARRQAEAAGVGAVCRHEEAYPPELRPLVDAPAVLFFCGSAARLRALADEPAVAVVGSRRASPYGIEVAQALGRGLGVAGVTVVSGLALGIDAAAHRGCLEGQGLPVAVLAGGPDLPYPRRNASLHRRICDTGLVLSEMPSGQRAFRWSFPARNRLMAGLAGMTVVVEAADPSGSLITAGFAADLGRAVGAVPGRVTARTAAGTNALIADGAAVVRGPGDVLDELLGPGAGEAARAAGGRARVEALPREARRVLDAVEAGEGLSAIASAAGVSAGQARAALARLEADGLVVRGPLGAYERAAGR